MFFTIISLVVIPHKNMIWKYYIWNGSASIVYFAFTFGFYSNLYSVEASSTFHFYFLYSHTCLSAFGWNFQVAKGDWEKKIMMTKLIIFFFPLARNYMGRYYTYGYFNLFFFFNTFFFMQNVSLKPSHFNQNYTDIWFL